MFSVRSTRYPMHKYTFGYFPAMKFQDHLPMFPIRVDGDGDGEEDGGGGKNQWGSIITHLHRSGENLSNDRKGASDSADQTRKGNPERIQHHTWKKRNPF